MRNFSLLLKLTLIVGIIALLNFTNFDLDYNNSLATDNVAIQSISQSSEAEVENASSQSKEIYTVQKANLSSTDSFDSEAIPYFQTETIPPSAKTITITITNHWNAPIIAEIKNSNTGSVEQNYNVGASSSTYFEFTPSNSIDITISANNKDGFRDWVYQDNGFITTSGESYLQASSFVHIPDIRYFTKDSSGTEAGDYFFRAFFAQNSATSLPDDSFNISTITKVGEDFFAHFCNTCSLTSLPENSFDTSSIKEVSWYFFTSFNQNGKLSALPIDSFNLSSINSADFGFFLSFNQSGSLESLPEGSFNTSNITQVTAPNFFSAFNWSGKLTSLPEGSFNFDALQNLTPNAFDGFNKNGSLTALPINSFNLENCTSCSGGYNFQDFNNGGKLTKYVSGVAIKNISSQTLKFYWAENVLYAPGNQEVNPGTTFSAYAVDVTLSFDSNGGSKIDPSSTSQGQKFFQPSNPTKSGYRFVKWLVDAENKIPYDWNATASSDLTITAQWVLDQVIINISPQEIENGTTSYVVITGSNLNDTSYSYRVSSSRFGTSGLPGDLSTFSQVYPSASISGRTDTSATLIIPTKVEWAGTYTIELLREAEMPPTMATFIYQLSLGPAKNFSDTSKLSASRIKNIKWLAQTGVSGGCNSAGTKYCPEDPVNRGSMAVFLQLLAGYPSGTSKTSSFADVFAGSAKTITYVSGSKTTKTKVSALTKKRIAAVNWLSLTGITGGSGSAKVNGKVVNTYRPQDVLSRGSMASFMLKFSENTVKTITSDAQTGFADIKIGSGNFTITYSGSKTGESVPKLSAARATAVKWMQTAGITGGSGTDKNGKVTYRAQDSVNRGSMATFMKNLAVYMKFTS